MVLDAGGSLAEWEFDMQTYTTKALASLAHVHPNTVRLYERLQFITCSERKANGYRVFTDIHVIQMQLTRLSLRSEILQHGLRDQALYILRRSADLDLEGALDATAAYASGLEEEIVRARSAVSDVASLLASDHIGCPVALTRKQTALRLGLTIDTLRNWELNGLIQTKRSRNGYRIYDGEDLKRLSIIRTLRLANYSLMSILRLMNGLEDAGESELETILNTPAPSEDIISVCDRLLISLEAAKADALQMEQLLLKIMHLMEPSTEPPDF
jgi:DNA-binding transcriptional MerR regulator